MEDNEAHGWVTKTDGTRSPMIAKELADLMEQVQKSKDRQATAFPETSDALRAFIDADERLHDLGWQKYLFGIEDGTELAIAEKGSTGIFRGVWQKPYLHYQDCVASMGKHFVKHIAELTEAERAKMAECEERHAEFMEHHTKSMQALQALLERGEE